MPRYLCTVAYDGRPYAGWQSQPGGNTIQDTLEQAIATVLKTPVRIHASGRTDAGVHAEGQTFHLQMPDTCRIPPERWSAALNAHLPATIRILHTRSVPETLHARYDAQGKTYIYKICRTSVLSPFMAGLAWHLPLPLDENLLSQALKLYEGTHDYRAFAARRGNEPHPLPDNFYTRTIHQATMEQTSGGLITITFRGTGFLYRMVRLLVGGAYQIARGKETLDDLRQLLESPGHRKSRYCAPPDGLYLQQVAYRPDDLETPL